MYDTQKGPIETAAVLMNSGLLDKIKPKIILIQSLERFCIDRFSGDINFSETDQQEHVITHYLHSPDIFNYLPKINFINNGNLKYIYYRFLYLFSDSATKKVRTCKLKKPLFNVKNEDLLLFFSDDARDVVKSTKENVERLNFNMNKLADILERRGIKLYFMPVVDKYNLYSEFIINNRYGKSVFFEELRKLPKKYEFIDTKEILLEAVRRGEKDIYYADDTHWSWRAAELVFNRIRFDQRRQF